MSTETIQAGNRLIADFDPALKKVVSVNSVQCWERGGYDVYPEELQYHRSFDWLMPVLESIPKLNPDNGKLHFEFEISRCHCAIWSNRQTQWKNNWDTTIGATWKSVVEFITWYNSTTELSKPLKP